MAADIPELLPSNREKPLLRTHPEAFEKTWFSKKLHEVRKDDRGYAVGMKLVLGEWNAETSKFTGRFIHIRIEYISRPPCYGLLPEGTCVFTFAIEWREHVGRMTSGPNVQTIKKAGHGKEDSQS